MSELKADPNAAMKGLVIASEAATTRAVLLMSLGDREADATAAQLLEAAAHGFEVFLKASQMYGSK